MATRRRRVKKVTPPPPHEALDPLEVVTVDKLVLHFRDPVDTKTKRKFTEVVEEHEVAASDLLYVTKHALEQLGNPEKLRVTIEPE